MSSPSDPVASTSQALVIYDPTLPHISVKSHLEAVTDDVYKRSMELAKLETRHLSPLDQRWKERVVVKLARGLSHIYIDKEMGQKMARLILHNFRSGKYDAAANPLSFTQSILQDLRVICPDKHLDLVCTLQPMPDYDPDRSLRTLEDDELTPQQTEYMASLNADRSDFSKEVESHMIPDTEIGYFKIARFPSLDFPETGPIIDKAMQNVMDAEALVIDLRDNTGGDPATVAFLASYLFDKRELINQIHYRADNKMVSFYAEPEKLDQSFGGKKPVYILTSEKSFSGAEELAYDLQAAGRAKVIGQTTAGGAHPVRYFVADDHVLATIPYGKAINPHTGKNWEATGVVPDYPLAKEEDALAFARSLIEG